MPPLAPPPFAHAASQSALTPAGLEAEKLAALFWWMTGGAVVIWLLTAALAVYAAKFGAGPAARKAYIVWGGAVFPALTLSALLLHGLPLLPVLSRPAPDGALRVEVTGHQWWWRVRYRAPGTDPVELANELRLPVGEPVEFELRSADVIHSFWIPSLAGKMDMIPGRATRLIVQPTRTGRFRGVCAEYCGASHALMAFEVVVLEKPEFERWLEGQRASGAEPAAGKAGLGRSVFAATGCAACHAVRGGGAEGTIGPDLTHVGGRLSLAAGTLPPGAEGLRRWLERTHELKPGALMPRFAMLPPAEREALAAYLEALK